MRDPEKLIVIGQSLLQRIPTHDPNPSDGQTSPQTRIKRGCDQNIVAYLVLIEVDMFATYKCISCGTGQNGYLPTTM